MKHIKLISAIMLFIAVFTGLVSAEGEKDSLYKEQYETAGADSLSEALPDDTRRYFEENGVRYHHILDPKTGCPAESGLVSVTVLCENGAWADALSTACFVLGPDGALALRDDLADQGTDFELILATDDGRVLYTDGLADAFTPNDESGYTYEALA